MVALYNHRRRPRLRPRPRRRLRRTSVEQWRGRLELHSKSINSTSKVLKIGPTARASARRLLIDKLAGVPRVAREYKLEPLLSLSLPLSFSCCAGKVRCKMCSKLSALKANQHANNVAASARRLKSHVPLIATVADTLVQGETSDEVGQGGVGVVSTTCWVNQLQVVEKIIEWNEFVNTLRRTVCGAGVPQHGPIIKYASCWR